MATITTEVVALRDDDARECFRVFVTVDGVRAITTPQFRDRGAALAYARLLESGYRRPEIAR